LDVDVFGCEDEARTLLVPRHEITDPDFWERQLLITESPSHRHVVSKLIHYHPRQQGHCEMAPNRACC
jgi:hypothetical protein